MAAAKDALALEPGNAELKRLAREIQAAEAEAAHEAALTAVAGGDEEAARAAACALGLDEARQRPRQRRRHRNSTWSLPSLMFPVASQLSRTDSPTAPALLSPCRALSQAAQRELREVAAAAALCAAVAAGDADRGPELRSRLPPLRKALRASLLNRDAFSAVGGARDPSPHPFRSPAGRG